MGEDYNIDICNMNAVAVALRHEDCFLILGNAWLMWLPDTAYF